MTPPGVCSARARRQWGRPQRAALRAVAGLPALTRARRADFGNFQDAEGKQKEKAERLRFGRFFYRFPNGESGADVYDRMTIFEARAPASRQRGGGGVDMLTAECNEASGSSCGRLLAQGTCGVACIHADRPEVGLCARGRQRGRDGHEGVRAWLPVSRLAANHRSCNFLFCMFYLGGAAAPQDHLIRDINAGRYAGDTALVLVTHGLALRIFLMRWFHWRVDQFMSVFNPPNAEARPRRDAPGAAVSPHPSAPGQTCLARMACRAPVPDPGRSNVLSQCCKSWCAGACCSGGACLS